MKNVLADGRWTQRGVVCGCLRAGTTARLCRSGVKREGGWAGTALSQIVLNSSSLYTLFYSAIYNSVSPPIYCRPLNAGKLRAD